MGEGGVIRDNVTLAGTLATFSSLVRVSGIRLRNSARSFLSVGIPRKVPALEREQPPKNWPAEVPGRIRLRPKSLKTFEFPAEKVHGRSSGTQNPRENSRINKRRTLDLVEPLRNSLFARAPAGRGAGNETNPRKQLVRKTGSGKTTLPSAAAAAARKIRNKTRITRGQQTGSPFNLSPVSGRTKNGAATRRAGLLRPGERSSSPARGLFVVPAVVTGLDSAGPSIMAPGV